MITPKYDDDLEYDEDDLLFQVLLLKIYQKSKGKKRPWSE